ncbi:MAG TPA: hypothetical protein PLL69_08980 [Gemmatimonadales bacterium]|nr:hypothetical protein [Gemmatimonadales bacterium]
MHSFRSKIASSLILLAACSGGGDNSATEAVTRDSTGVAITEYPAEAWENAPVWAVGAAPLATIGGDDESVDLTNSQVGTLLSDGRVVAASMQPPQVYVFNPDGTQQGTLGRSGEGPGEYRFLSRILALGGDTVAGYDLFTRRALLFDVDGESLGFIEFPMTGVPIPPILTGRLADGTWLFQVTNPMEEPPEGTTGVYRKTAPVLTWREGAEAYDTVFTSKGPMLIQGTVGFGSQTTTMGRGVGFGANSFVDGSGDLIWSTTSERFIVDGHSADGALQRSIRVNLPVREITEVDKEAFRETMKDALRRVASLAPPELIQSEIDKVDEMAFAPSHPAIGQMLVDRQGRVWVTTNTPMVDSVAVWGVFDPDGKLLGKLTLPAGNLYAASGDRIVVRIEDKETGLVRLEVLGILRDM